MVGEQRAMGTTMLMLSNKYISIILATVTRCDSQNECSVCKHFEAVVLCTHPKDPNICNGRSSCKIYEECGRAV